MIATRASGIPDGITENETGLLVDADDVRALETDVELLIDEPCKRRQLAAAAFELVTLKCSCERMCDAYQQVYRDVMDST